MRHAFRLLSVVFLLAQGGCDRQVNPTDSIRAKSPTAAVKVKPANSERLTKEEGNETIDETPALALESEGIRLFDKATGAARPIAFGTPRPQVMNVLAFRGPPGTGTNGECGAGPLQYANWPDGLGLFFQNDKFVGWNADGRGEGALATASGIGPGSTRANLEAAYKVAISKTTLGTEFAAGELFGILDGDRKTARITNMWAGASCNFR